MERQRSKSAVCQSILRHPWTHPRLSTHLIFTCQGYLFPHCQYDEKCCHQHRNTRTLTKLATSSFDENSVQLEQSCVWANTSRSNSGGDFLANRRESGGDRDSVTPGWWNQYRLVRCVSGTLLGMILTVLNRRARVVPGFHLITRSARTTSHISKSTFVFNTVS